VATDVFSNISFDYNDDTLVLKQVILNNMDSPKIWPRFLAQPRKLPVSLTCEVLEEFIRGILEREMNYPEDDDNNCEDDGDDGDNESDEVADDSDTRIAKFLAFVDPNYSPEEARGSKRKQEEARGIS
jgi:hypothetical protein